MRRLVFALPALISLLQISAAFATTKGLNQIVTPDLQDEGDLSLSLQVQDPKIANPDQIQSELGLTKWAEIAVFKGFEPNELIFSTELGLIQKEPYLLSTGFINWSPHSGVDPQPYIEAGYYTEHHKIILEQFTPVTKTKRSSATLTTSIKPGGFRSIGKAARKIQAPSVSPVT